MDYDEYKRLKEDLEMKLRDLMTLYINTNGLPIGTPVIPLQRSGGYSCSFTGELCHVFDRQIGYDGRIDHTIIKAKKDGTMAKGGRQELFDKKDLQVVEKTNEL